MRTIINYLYKLEDFDSTKLTNVYTVPLPGDATPGQREGIGPGGATPTRLHQEASLVRPPSFLSFCFSSTSHPWCPIRTRTGHSGWIGHDMEGAVTDLISHTPE